MTGAGVDISGASISSLLMYALFTWLVFENLENYC